MKEFAMLSATQRLTQYFMREFGRLDAMGDHLKDMEQKARSIRIDEINELSDALNELFGTLSDSPGSKLFPSYREKHSEEGSNAIENVNQDVVTNASVEDQANLLSPAQERISKMLNEYHETSPRDIARHLPENDRPCEVLTAKSESVIIEKGLPDEDEDSNQSADGASLYGIDKETKVQTSLDNGDEGAIKGTDINLKEYLTTRSNPIMTGLIEADIRSLRLGNNEGGGKL